MEHENNRHECADGIIWIECKKCKTCYEESGNVLNDGYGNVFIDGCCESCTRKRISNRLRLENRIPTICDCGSCIFKQNMKRHKLTKKHLATL